MVQKLRNTKGSRLNTESSSDINTALYFHATIIHAAAAAAYFGGREGLVDADGISDFVSRIMFMCRPRQLSRC